LCKVATEEEAIEVISAMTQIYRENARYLDRIYKWLDRVGLDWVKAQIVDDAENRKALACRFQLSQSVYRKDPWAEHAQDSTTRAQYAPLANLTLEAAE